MSENKTIIAVPHLESSKGARAFIGDQVNLYLDNNAYAGVVIGNIYSDANGIVLVAFQNNPDIVPINIIRDFRVMKRAEKTQRSIL